MSPLNIYTEETDEIISTWSVSKDDEMKTVLWRHLASLEGYEHKPRQTEDSEFVRKRDERVICQRELKQIKSFQHVTKIYLQSQRKKRPKLTSRWKVKILINLK